jgi:hypothetical protein
MKKLMTALLAGCLTFAFAGGTFAAAEEKKEQKADKKKDKKKKDEKK